MLLLLIIPLVILSVVSFQISTSTHFQVQKGTFLVMRERKCDITGTRRNAKCYSISKSKAHMKKVQMVNLHKRKLWWAEGNKFVRIRIAARTMKTIRKNGLHATAKKHGINLNQYAISSGTGPRRPDPFEDEYLKIEQEDDANTPFNLDQFGTK